MPARVASPHPTSNPRPQGRDHGALAGLWVAFTLLAGPHVWRAFRGQAAPAPGYYDTPPAKRIEYAVLYLGLTAWLAVMTHDVHEMLAAVRG